jgi:hypothetical protein
MRTAKADQKSHHGEVCLRYVSLFADVYFSASSADAERLRGCSFFSSVHVWFGFAYGSVTYRTYRSVRRV